MNRIAKLAGVAALVACASMARAQWTNNPASPLSIGDGGDSPVVLPTSDGGCYVAWQGTTGGVPYNSVHLQRLDSAGHELWGHGGIVAVMGNSSFSQAGEFDVAIASDGNALVSTSILMPDTSNPTVHQATVQKFSAADGSRMWGTGGGDVSVTTGAFQISWAHVCSEPDGGCVVGYTFTSGGTVLLRFMRMSSTGTPVWSFPGTQVFINGTFLNLTGMVSGGADGSFIALWGKGGTSLQTQKFTGGSGTTPGVVFSSAWGTATSPITIENGGMTGFNFYQGKMISDGNGGAIYGWSSFTSGFAGCSTALLQHIQSNGTAKFATPLSGVDHTIVPCGGSGTGQYSARVAFWQDSVSPPSYHYFLASEQGPSANGSVTSALVQKFDNTGSRVWSESGVVVVPAVNSGVNWINPAATSDGGCICVGNLNAGLAYASDAAYAAKVVDDPSFPGYGMVAWRTIVNSNTATSKGRTAVTRATGSDDVLVAQVAGPLTAYKVSAANGAPGSNPTAPTIDVDVPAVITACDGDTVTISVQVSGTTPINYQWQRHYAYNVTGNADAAWGLNEGDSSFNCIVPADGTTYTGTHTASLTIHGVHANNPTAACPNSDPILNMYRCQVYNAGSGSGQSSTSSWAQLIVGAGACCASDGSCTSVCAPASCVGVYQGSGSVCVPNPCGGACCGTAACTITTSAGCNGSFQGNGTTCTPIPCTGVCCDNSTGACTTTMGATSCGSGFTFQGFVTSCTPQPCPQPGACCNNANGACTLLVQGSCGGGSTFHGAGSTCDGDPCAPTGACCSTIDGSYCVNLTQTACVGLNTRRWQGAGTSCDTMACPQPAACCNPSTGACTFVSQAGCASPNTFQGDGTFCQPTNPCPQPAVCCNSSTGACTIVGSPAECAGLSLVAESCQPSPCPSPIACCSPSGCSLSLPTFCGNPAPGGATTCSASPCSTSGTCCRGATCTTTFTSASACSGSLSGALAGSVFIANGACNSTGNNRTPCCYADYNKVGGLSVQDIFDFLNDWFAGRSFAAVGSSGTGATLNVQNIFDFLNVWFAGC